MCEQDFYLCVLHSWILTPELFAFESEAFQIKDVYRSQYFGHTHSLWRYRALTCVTHGSLASVLHPHLYRLQERAQAAKGNEVGAVRCC